MSELIEKLELEFQPAFDARVRQIIAEQTITYTAKYPFVGKITVGMGTVAVDDKSGIIMHGINWDYYNERCEKENGGADSDDIFDEINAERAAANEDEFIRFLHHIQYHRLCSFCPEDIVLP